MADDLSAVDIEDLPGDPLRLIREQEDTHSHQILGLAHAAERDSLHNVVDHAAGVVVRLASVSIGPGRSR